MSEPGMMPIRYRCGSCGADEIIQAPAQRRQVGEEYWREAVERYIGKHHEEHHKDCPVYVGGEGHVNIMFPLEGQSEEMLRSMDWPKDEPFGDDLIGDD
jgi:hypothetical protein